MTDATRAVEDLVHAAQRRRFLLLSFDGAVWAALGSISAGCISLLLGSDIWPLRVSLAVVMLSCAVCCASVIRIRNDEATVARLLDRTGGLHDSLATAWSVRNGTHPLASAQIAYAARIAQTVDVRRVLPLRVGATANAAAGAALLLCGILLIRWSHEDRLEFRHSILRLALERRAVAEKDVANVGHPGGESAREAVANGSVPPVPLTDAAQAGTKGVAAEQPNQNPGLPTEGRGTSGGKSSASDGRAQAQKGGGLLSDLRDAIKSAIDDLREGSKQSNPNSGAGDSKQQGSGREGDAQREAASAKDRKEGNPQTGEQQANGAESRSGGHGGDDGSAADKGGSAAGDAAQSGAGSQDGSKQLREAEDRQAKAEIMKLLGKRSAALTGKMSLQRQAPNQQLQTGRSGYMGEHNNVGAEQHHNQVPPELRDYVEQYTIRMHSQPKK